MNPYNPFNVSFLLSSTATSLTLHISVWKQSLPSQIPVTIGSQVFCSTFPCKVITIIPTQRTWYRAAMCFSEAAFPSPFFNDLETYTLRMLGSVFLCTPFCAHIPFLKNLYFLKLQIKHSTCAEKRKSGALPPQTLFSVAYVYG